MKTNRINRALILKITVSLVVVLSVVGVFLIKRTSTQVTIADSQVPDASSRSAKESQFAAESRPVAESRSAAPSDFSVVPRQPERVESSSLHVRSPIDYEALRFSGLPVLIDYGADSCIPCKEMAPVLAELNKTLEGKAIIRFVDVWKYRELAQGVPLQVIPTQVLFDAEGKPFTPPDSLQLGFKMYNTRDSNEHVFTTHEGGLDKDQMLAILTAMGMK